MKLALLNTTIMTTDGTYTVETVSLDRAKYLINAYLYSDDDVQPRGLDSAIGHESTAAIMSQLLGVNVPMNRQQFVQQIGQAALVFKLKGRPPEGSILTIEEIEAVGYEFKVMTRLK